jgi:hypothetical protein
MRESTTGCPGTRWSSSKAGISVELGTRVWPRRPLKVAPRLGTAPRRPARRVRLNRGGRVNSDRPRRTSSFGWGVRLVLLNRPTLRIRRRFPSSSQRTRGSGSRQAPLHRLRESPSSIALGGPALRELWNRTPEPSTTETGPRGRWLLGEGVEPRPQTLCTTRVSPRRRHRSPRSETREHSHPQGRPAHPGGFRSCRTVRRTGQSRVSRACRTCGRDCCVHVTGAGPWRARGREGGSLCTWMHLVRAARRQAAVRWPHGLKGSAGNTSRQPPSRLPGWWRMFRLDSTS